MGQNLEDSGPRKPLMSQDKNQEAVLASFKSLCGLEQVTSSLSLVFLCVE